MKYAFFWLLTHHWIISSKTIFAVSQSSKNFIGWNKHAVLNINYFQPLVSFLRQVINITR